MESESETRAVESESETRAVESETKAMEPESESESELESNYQNEAGPLFEERFLCLPMKEYKHPHLQTGDKIIMPPSALSQIISLDVKYPLLFKIQSCSNSDKIKVSHCGVLEFGADEGLVHMPEWMMQNLGIEAGEEVVVSSADLPKAQHMKLRPHLTAFTKISNPRAVLENNLTNFACLSKGDTFLIEYNEVEFYLDVVEVMPGDAVCLIDTDCTVEFESPMDYVEEDRLGINEEVNGEVKEVEEKEFRAFSGKGQRLDGEAVAVVESAGKYRAAAAEAVVEGSSKVVFGKRRRSDNGGKEEDEGSSKVVFGKRKRSDNGGKDEDDNAQAKFKPFSGKSRVLGGPLL